MARPDFVVIGHLVRDLLAGGWRPGGTVTFAAAQAQALGMSVGVVTRAAPEVDFHAAFGAIPTAGRPSVTSTSFENIYDGGHRRQRVPSQAEPVTIDDVPPEWRSAPMVLVGPVLGEIGTEMCASLSSPFIGVSAQGWLRELDDGGWVRPSSWRGPPFWAGARVLFVSDEDLGGDLSRADAWTSDVPVVALTMERRGARVAAGGRWHEIDAYPAQEIDPTGAGDVFAAAFLVRYHETRDPAEAAHFAAAAASCSVEGIGTERIAARDQIEERMKEHPEIVLR